MPLLLIPALSAAGVVVLAVLGYVVGRLLARREAREWAAVRRHNDQMRALRSASVRDCLDVR